MSRKFIPSSKSRPCSVCGDAKGKCRHTKPDEIRLCMNYAGCDDLLGWRFLGNTRNDLWGKFVPDDGESGKSWQDRQEEIAKRIERDRAREQEKLKYALPIDERSAEFRKLLLQLNLEEDHYQDLLKRGLTDQEIQSGLYRTVTPNQQIKEVKGNLPGIWNNKIIVSGRGYLCPVWDEYGRIVGCQVRLDQTDDEGGKYRWLKGKFPSHLPNGELPLTVVKGEENGVHLVEGISKPYIAQKIHGGTWIGASGGNFSSSPEQLKRILGNVAKDQPIYFASDAGSLPNPHTARRDRKTVELVQSLGYEVYVLDWGQLHDKSVGDADEISQEQLDHARLIAGDDFLEFPKPDFDAPEFVEPDLEDYETYEQELEDEEFREEAEKERDQEIWRQNFPIAAKNLYNRNKKFTPDRTINTPRLEDSDIPEIYEVEQIFGLRSGLGTGKTEAIKRLAQAYPDEGFLTLLNRNTLGINSADRLNFIHLRSNDYAYQQGKTRVPSQALISDPSSRLILCFDSLPRLTPEDFNGRNLVIDEGTAGILHLLTSTTAVRDRLEKVLELFKEALQRAKRVIVLDGMLNDATIDYLHQLAPNKTPVKILNTHQNPVDITNLTGTWEQTEEELLDKINKNDRVPWLQLMKESAVLALFTDSQVFAAAMEKQFQNDGMQGVRIDSTTVGEDYAKAFLNNPDAYIEKHQPDYIICTPSVESGTDISIRNYFTAGFYFYFGAIGTNAQHQMMFRIRDEQMPRYLWVKEFSKTTEDWRSPFPKTTMRNYRDMLWQDIENCFAAGEDVTEKLKALTEMSQDNPHDKMLSTLQSIDHYEKGNLRECLLESLENAGHSITSKLPEKISDKTETELKDEVKDQRAEDIYQAQDIDDEMLEDYRQSGKYEKLVCAWKALLLKKLPGIEETEFWNPELIRALKFEQSDWIRQLERRWMFYNPDQARLLQRKKWHKALEGYIGKYQIRSDFSKTKALKEAGIERFINAETGTEWHQESPELQEFLEECKKHAFKKQFGAKPGRKTRAISWLSRCLEVFGYRLKERRQQENGERIRYYRLDRLPPEDNILYQCVKERLSKVAHQAREEEAQKEQTETRNDNKGETPSQQGFNQWPARPYEYIYNNGHAGHFDINQKESKSTPVGLTEIVNNLDGYYEGYALEFAPEILNELRANSERAEGQKERYCSKHLSLKSEKADEIKEALLSIQSKADLNFFKENMPYANLSNRVWRDLLTQEQREAIQQIKNGTGEPDNVAYGDFEKSQYGNHVDDCDRAGSNGSGTPVNDDCRRQATSLHRAQENLFPVEVGDYITIQHSVAKPSTLKVVSVEVKGDRQEIRYEQPGWHMNPWIYSDDKDLASITDSEGDIKWQRDRQLVSSA